MPDEQPDTPTPEERDLPPELRPEPEERVEESELERESREEATEEAREAALRRAWRPKIRLREDIRPAERYAIIGGFGLLVLLLFTVIAPDSPLHPIFPTLALIFFLYPFSTGLVSRRIIQLGLLTFFVWLFFRLSGVLFPFIISFVFAYLFSPLVGYLARRGIPPWVTSLLVALMIIGVYSVIGFVLIPAFVGQFDQLLASVQGFVQGADRLLDSERMIEWLQGYGMGHAEAKELVTEYIEPQLQGLTTGLINWFTDFVKNITGIIEGLANLILIPFLSFYLTVDFERIRRFVKSVVLQDRPEFVYYVKRVDTIVSGYMRGILLTSSLVGAVATGTLMIFDVPYAIVLGILTGVFNLIPTLGMFLNLGVAVIIFALVDPNGFLMNTIVMSATIFGLHAINGYFIEPKIIGDRVGVHPVLVIASLFIFAYFLGFVGLLVAVPVTAVTLMFLKEWYQHTIILKEPTYEPGP